ncbi:MAG TPA: F0F1 ATP synthase subunit A [Tenuifilaceae bacterium]|nr:F0F1 ATP synthase subunit A [Tenuifilaceae bacterium]
MKRIVILVILFFPLIVQARVGDPAINHIDTLSSSNEHQPAKFNATDFIFDHIGDSFEWHIFTANHHHYSIPLPIILYSKNTGFHIFLSNKFHSPDGIYSGFRIEKEGKHKGKIVELTDSGEIDETEPLPLDFSLTKNAITVLFVCSLLCWIFISIANKYKRNPNVAPTGLQNLLEPIILFVKNEIAIPSIGERNHIRFMPFLLTMFFFIWITNMLGLIPIFPGGANVTGNIAVTLSLALFTFVVVNINGNRHYWKDIINAPGVPWFLKLPIPIMPLVELMGIFIKPFVLMVRLFANILAGHMVAIVFMSLIFIFAAMNVWLGYVAAPISILFSVFMTVLELLVALIQAYVFTLLSAIYIGMATAEHH